MMAVETEESLISFQTSQGLDLHATPLKLTRFAANFEVYGPAGILRTSEALSDFRIMVQGRLVYSGRAVVSNLIHMGAMAVCEATLDEACLDLGAMCPLNEMSTIEESFGKFVQEWGKVYKVLPEFKVTMADMQMLFLDLRLWMEQMELSVRAQPSGDRGKIERDLLEALQRTILPLPEPLLDQFELIARTVP